MVGSFKDARAELYAATKAVFVVSVGVMKSWTSVYNN